MPQPKTCYHVNLYPGFGGSEVYTRFFCNAFAKLGWQVVLFIHPKADYWRRLDMPGVRLVEVERLEGALAHLPQERSLVIDHSPEPGEAARRIRAGHLFVGVVYQPVYERDPEQYRVYEVLWHLSHHIENSLRQAGFANLHPEPFYGPGHAQRLSTSAPGPVVANSPNVWDPRKVRDRLLGALSPVAAAFGRPQVYAKRPGVTLGIVSRIADIKKFPELFGILSPVIAKFPSVWLEVFGKGGYASVRDFRRSLAPIRDRVRFWGHQEDVGRIYPLMDYLMTGLPEREGFGMNVVEALYCGTPVLAPDGPPFDENVATGKTGYLYPDPRKDGGAGFEDLLRRLVALPRPIDPRDAPDCLREFSFERFVERVQSAVAALPAA